MSDRIVVNLAHPANTKVLAYLSRHPGEAGALPSEPAEKYDSGWYEGLGTHPDLINILWYDFNMPLPEDCKWVVFARPVLVHPKTGVIFAFAGGTSLFSVRLPLNKVQEVLEERKAKPNNFPDFTETLGEEWVSRLWYEKDKHYYQEAYEYAGTLVAPAEQSDLSWYDITIQAQGILTTMGPREFANLANPPVYTPKEEQNRAKASELAKAANSLLDSQPDLSLLLSLEAWELAQSAEAMASLLLGLHDRMKLGTFLESHPVGVEGVAFNHDGTILATSSNDRTIVLWDVATGTKLIQLKEHIKQVMSVAFSPDGKLLVSGDLDHTIILWEVSTGTPLGTVNEFSRGVLMVAFSPDGSMFAAVSADKSVKLWAVEGLKKLAGFEGHKSLVQAVAFSPDGKFLASCGNDGSAMIWDIESKTCVADLTNGSGALDSLVFTPDGQYLIVASSSSLLYIWEIATQKKVGQLKTPGGELGIDISSDGKLLAGGTRSGHLTLRKMDELLVPTIMLNAIGGGINCIAFSPDNKVIAMAGANGRVGLWDTDPVSWREKVKKVAKRNLTPAEWAEYFGNEPYRKTFLDLE